MTDSTAQLDFLRAQRDAASDATSRAMFEQLIATLEAQLPPSQQTITGQAQVGVAVAGDVHGHIFLAGQRGKTAGELLHAYLRRLAQRCGTLPLQGVREQRAADDVLRISLDQVYTQLATTTLVAREHFDTTALRALDTAAYHSAHTGTRLLPGQQRTLLQHAPLLAEQVHRADPLGGRALLAPGAHGLPGDGVVQEFQNLNAEAFAGLAVAADWMICYGPQLISEALADQRRLVLLGEPGSGKSTALRFLALTLAEAGLDNQIELVERLPGWEQLGAAGRLLPIMLPLLPLAKRLAGQSGHTAGAADLWNELAEQLEPRGANAGLAAAVHDELEQGRVLLLLDGLDEVAGADSRGQVVAAVQAFAEQYATCRIVVACRVRAYVGEQNAEWQLPGWPTATLADWMLGQMEQFVVAWYTAAAYASDMPSARRDAQIDSLQRAIGRRGDLQRLGTRPLLLTIMALVHLNDGRLPEDRVTLYSRCIDILLAQWELRGKDETVYGTLMAYIGLPDADVRSLRALLEEAAFVAHTASTPGSPGRLGRAELGELVMRALAERKHSNPYVGAQRFLEYADVRAGLLQASDAGDAYIFPHQTFQEYLAGLRLVSGVGVVERIVERRHDDRWRLPILLGIADHVSGNKLELPLRLLHRLRTPAGKPQIEAQRDLLLAAEIGDDVGWERLERGGAEFTELREALAHALADVLTTYTLPAAERVRAGVLLGSMGDPRPGVCTLPPAMVNLPSRQLVLGIGSDEATGFAEEYLAAYRADGNLADDDFRRALRAYVAQSINEQPLPLPAFAVARYPVTNAQYAQFIANDGYNSAQPWWDADARIWLARDDSTTEGLETYQRRKFKDRPEYWQHERFGIARPNHPVVGITWYEAMAFGHWLTTHLNDGFVYNLPSEAEWEYAARGVEQRMYSWGTDQPDERANYENQYGGTTAVGCFPDGATPEGVLDMAGNVWEWTRSEFRPYPYDPSDGREAVDVTVDKSFTIRGGGWNNRSIYLRAAGRYSFRPVLHDNDVGFRLARHPKSVKH